MKKGLTIPTILQKLWLQVYKFLVGRNSVSITPETLLGLFPIYEGVLISMLISTGIHRCHAENTRVFTASHAGTPLHERYTPLEHLFAHHVLQTVHGIKLARVVTHSQGTRLLVN